MRIIGIRKLPINVSTKINATMILLLMLSIFLLAYQTYRISSRLIHIQNDQYIGDMMMQTGKNIEASFQDFSDLMFSLQFDPSVQEGLTKLLSPQTDDYSKYLLAGNITSTIYNKILYNDVVESVFVVSNQGEVVSVIKSLATYGVEGVDTKRIFDNQGTPVWLGIEPERGCLLMGAEVNSVVTQRSLGYVVINVSERYVSSIFADMEFAGSGTIAIIDEQMQIISSRDKDLLGTVLPDDYAGILRPGVASDLHEKTFEDFSVNLVTYRALGTSSWYLMASVPSFFYQQTIHALRVTILVLAGSIVAVVILLSLLITHSITRPIKRLTHSMQAFGSGDFSVTCPVETADEIGLLAENFNSMVSNINDLVERVYRETLLKQQVELKSLRMQINPHFFFNTLETINWMARINGVNEIGVVAKALGDMMRTTIGGSDFITIQEELKTIRDYVKIQTFRYGEKIRVSIDVEDSMLNHYIPKLILQPMIENAMVHGLEKKPGDGNVIITGREEGEELTFIVEDDGVGIPEERLRCILDESDAPKDGTSSIGLINVSRRLQLYYGEKYGVRIESALNSGTRVSITVPKRSRPQG